MSDSTIPEADAAEAKRRAEWLHKHKAHKDWIILSVSEVAVIRDELLKLEQERDEAREAWYEMQSSFERSRDEVEKLIRERDEARRDEAREHLRAANKGAETNAKINQSLANQIINANAMADKAKELVARWDQPSWKDTAPTAGFIYALRDAVEAYERGKK